MVRSYDEPVQVRKPVTAPTPTAFRWHGRHYVVREVLAHWYERRAWWTEDAARAAAQCRGRSHRPSMRAPGCRRRRSRKHSM